MNKHLIFALVLSLLLTGFSGCFDREVTTTVMGGCIYAIGDERVYIQIPDTDEEDRFKMGENLTEQEKEELYKAFDESRYVFLTFTSEIGRPIINFEVTDRSCSYTVDNND